MMDKKMAYYWCTNLQMAAPYKIIRLIEAMGGVMGALDCSDEKLTAYGFTQREINIYHDACKMQKSTEEEYVKLKEQGIRFVTVEDEDYPSLLLELPDRPVGLFVKGRLPGKDRPCVAVVGARACSSYGRECAEYISEKLAAAGVQIISGMAYGVDCYGQAAALRSGTSFAVMAGGVDICYPRENYPLYEKLVACGGIISEMRPGTKGVKMLYPRRNRIISGMSRAVVVIEARKKSGSLITADFAADQGRYVYAVPGSIFSGLNEGSNELIRNGAMLLQSPDELLSDLHMEKRKDDGTKRQTQGKNLRAADRTDHKQNLDNREADVYSFIKEEPVLMEDLLRLTGYPAGSLAEILLHLELKGCVSREAAGLYRRVHRFTHDELCF